MPDECRTELGYFQKNFKTRISATSWRNTLTRAMLHLEKGTLPMNITQTVTVQVSLGDELASLHDLTVFTYDQLEALLEACGSSLRTGYNIAATLEECGTASYFDDDFLESVNTFAYDDPRQELIEAIVFIAARLHQLETDEVAA